MTHVFRAHAHDTAELGRLVREGLIRPLVADVYTPVGAPADLRARAAAIALLLPSRLREAGAIVAYEAASWLLASGPPPDQVDVYIAPHASRRGGTLIRVHEASVPPRDIETIDGVLVTTPSRTAADLARSRPAATAMHHLDQLRSGTGLTPQAALAALERLARHRGVPAGRVLVSAWARRYADPGSAELASAVDAPAETVPAKPAGADPGMGADQSARLPVTR